ncbi:NinI-like serine-threonine phosphatase [Halogranum tailed virus 1]|uniref:Metallophosphatase n=1 Tax=Halogranum tailed virus 1 TaxID=1273749 RepID=R4T9B5_9CAUD|nr:NinI-like serine-threonine phosphatase [Halogranum tailed virus 1]AGM11505.1 metallophosphatase [Halogranum tailed virus 1]
MSKVLVFSDVHGNLPAMEAVLTEGLNRNVDSFVSVGDTMGVLGWPQDTAKLVRDVTEHAVYGNHDAYFRSDFNWVPHHPSQKQEHRVVTENMYGCVQKWLDDLPEEVYAEYGDKTLYIVHANPFTPRLLDKRWGEYKCGYPADGYCGKGKYTKVASFVDADYVALGHTHQQAKLDCSKFGHDTIVFNPGSVGAPYDEPARFAILNTTENEVELCSTEYDVEKVKTRFEELNITEDGDYP